jgi:hypothetical protein
VRGHEARGARDFVMTMTDAKDLQADITRLLIDLRTLHNQAVTTDAEQVITVKMNGGSF